MQYYQVFPDLAGVYLEDSWVLELASSESELSLRFETVLTSEHSFYEPPKLGEQHCYRTAWLTVRSPEPVKLVLSASPPATDATGEVDFGNVDVFVFNPAEEHWELEGNWGSARVRNPQVTLQFD